MSALTEMFANADREPHEVRALRQVVSTDLPARAEPAANAADNAADDSEKDHAQIGRPGVLDEFNKSRVLRLIELGHSRRSAGRRLGMAGSTITRTAARDPQFFEDLAQAEIRADTDALKLIRETAQQERYWRAAAWLLERRNPEEYGVRAPHTFTGEQVHEMLSKMVYAVLPEVPSDRREAVLERFDDVVETVESKRGKDAKFTISWSARPEIEDSADIMPPAEAADTSKEVLRFLELGCPADTAGREEWITGLTQRQIEELLIRAHLRPSSPQDQCWINDLSERLSKLIRIRGGKLLLQQFSREGGK